MLYNPLLFSSIMAKYLKVVLKFLKELIKFSIFLVRKLKKIYTNRNEYIKQVKRVIIYIYTYLTQLTWAQFKADLIDLVKYLIEYTDKNIVDSRPFKFVAFCIYMSVTWVVSFLVNLIRFFIYLIIHIVKYLINLIIRIVKYLINYIDEKIFNYNLRFVIVVVVYLWVIIETIVIFLNLFYAIIMFLYTYMYF